MNRREFIAAITSSAVVASTLQAFARFMGGAFLDHAVPGVGLTVRGPVRELRLYFTIGVLAVYLARKGQSILLSFISEITSVLLIIYYVLLVHGEVALISSSSEPQAKGFARYYGRASNANVGAQRQR